MQCAYYFRNSWILDWQSLSCIYEVPYSETGEVTELSTDLDKEETADASKSTADESSANWDNNLTPAERRYMEQRERIDSHKLAKTSNKSHRDRIQDFNQYLANMSEHYDIPKVGPG